MMKFLYLLIAAACCAGCSSPETPQVETSTQRIEDVLSRIDKTVADPVRAEKMKGIVTELDSQLKVHEASLNAKRDAVIKASADYATTREDLKTLYAEGQQGMHAMMADIKAAHFAMKDLATPEEWKAVAGGKKQLIEFN